MWRDAPAVYGPPKTLYNRFIRWMSMGAQTRPPIGPQVWVWLKFRADLPGSRLLAVRFERFGPGDSGGWAGAYGMVG